MRSSQIKSAYVIKMGLTLFVIAGLILQSNLARAFDGTSYFQNIKQVFDQRVYIRNVNDTFFAKTDNITKGEKTPLGPKASSLAFCQTRGTPQFKVTAFKNFDSAVFKADMKALRKNMENRVLGKAVKSGMKIVKKTVSVIQQTGNKIKAKQVVAKVKEVFVKEKKIVSFSSVQRPVLAEPRAKNSLFSPSRKRMELGPAQHPIGLKKEKRLYLF